MLAPEPYNLILAGFIVLQDNANQFRDILF